MTNDLFEELDKDGNGALDEEEFYRFCDALVVQTENARDMDLEEEEVSACNCRRELCWRRASNAANITTTSNATRHARPRKVTFLFRRILLRAVSQIPEGPSLLRRRVGGGE